MSTPHHCTISTEPRKRDTLYLTFTSDYMFVNGLQTIFNNHQTKKHVISFQ